MISCCFFDCQKTMFFDSRRDTRAPSRQALPALVGARARHVATSSISLASVHDTKASSFRCGSFPNQSKCFDLVRSRSSISLAFAYHAEARDMELAATCRALAPTKAGSACRDGARVSPSTDKEHGSSSVSEMHPLLRQRVHFCVRISSPRSFA